MSRHAHPAAHVEFDLERLFSYRLAVLSNRINLAISRDYHRRFGLAITEWRVMSMLGRKAGMSAGEVAAHTALDKVAVSRAVAHLLERGLIQREIHDDDRRRSVLGLTEAGVKVHDEVAPLVMDYHKRLFASFSQEDRDTLEKLIDKLGEEGLPGIQE